MYRRWLRLVPILLLVSAAPARADQNAHRTANRHDDAITLPGVQQLWALYYPLARVPDPEKPDNLPQLEADIQVDGELTEPVWRRALIWRLDYEVSLAQSRGAPVKTLALIGMTRDALVFAFIAPDPTMSEVRSTLADRDRIRGDDTVVLVLDTFGDQRHAYEIFVNPRGIQADALRSETRGGGRRRRGRGEGGEDFNFDFLWEATARSYLDGYIVEGRIPLRYLRFRVNADGTALWRIGVFRNYPRDFQYRTSAVPWDFNRNCFLCQLPPVHVKIPVRPHKQIQIIPYTRGLYERSRYEAPDDNSSAISRDAAAGFDIKFQPAPTWVLDATVLPDFSQVETDVFQITTNIRFAPFYPEKRPFFLERTDLFATPLQVIYTRTLLDPTYGVRATGKTGPHTLAFLHLLDKNTYLIFPGVQRSSITSLENDSFNTLFRYRYDAGEQSTVGFLLTDKEYSNGYNRVAGIDANIYLTRSLVLTAQGLVTHSKYPSEVASDYDQPEDPFTGWGYWIQLNQRTRNYEFRLSWQELDESFRADMGFIQQVGVRELGFMGSYILWPQNSWFKRVSFFTFGRVQWDQKNLLQDRFVTFGTHIRGAAQTNLFLRYEFQRERVENVYIPSQKVSLNLNFQPTYWYRAGIRGEWGTEPDLTLVEQAQFQQISTEQTLLIRRSLEIRYEIRYQRLYQSTTQQDALINFLRLTWQLTPRLALRQIVQWQLFRYPDPRYREHDRPERDERWEMQSLLRYRINYATALYAGFYGRWSERDADRSSRWNIFFKLSYLFNL